MNREQLYRCGMPVAMPLMATGAAAILGGLALVVAFGVRTLLR